MKWFSNLRPGVRQPRTSRALLRDMKAGDMRAWELGGPVRTAMNMRAQLQEQEQRARGDQIPTARELHGLTDASREAGS